MRQPVALYCICGTCAEYAFETPGAAEEFTERWRNEHRGEGHAPMFRDDFRREQARVKREKQRQAKQDDTTGLLF